MLLYTHRSLGITAHCSLGILGFITASTKNSLYFCWLIAQNFKPDKFTPLWH